MVTIFTVVVFSAEVGTKLDADLELMVDETGEESKAFDQKLVAKLVGMDGSPGDDMLPMLICAAAPDCSKLGRNRGDSTEEELGESRIIVVASVEKTVEVCVEVDFGEGSDSSTALAGTVAKVKSPIVLVTVKAQEVASVSSLIAAMPTD
ncbi:MAG: hypothetical protein M1821_009208 [Bathelium mastoideum]|nr:MAG: hypothetical protein M1821_009208 [Bathelium mastoideum]